MSTTLLALTKLIAKLRNMMPSLTTYCIADSRASNTVFTGQLLIQHAPKSKALANSNYILFCELGERLSFTARRIGSVLCDSICYVVSICAQKQMRRVHAMPDITCMEHMHSLGDYAEDGFVGDSMGVQSLPVDYSCVSIPVLLDNAGEQPAAISLVHSLKDPLGQVGSAVVPTNKAVMLALDKATSMTGFVNTSGLLTAAALTEAGGNARIRVHSVPPIRCAGTPAVHTSAESFDCWHYSTLTSGVRI